ncbi:hypothetical protein A3C91_02450 [Candidatus Azambacteria bacterium RIFCSPHIGHO2_02_FULL_52_12]|uniref:Hydrogenase n=1 Tax=Candidatus Azambacteria bacterium RIFCSPLOWO2_01_FULL_46_25 TaxID=1797298 RepID=A0A1F5BVP4_9BACT|nr:MAG: hypothetical protein A3C91_02450 [Candidatus Azambacteria bacterium RIFCSPHIGHO2_02_FULL_52_12]OGD34682.1 MAG: hypothetical protein A2988_04245 [Candidatus Azambacteria bacterium RIFCSPLOWO2_01_FULL_46_25]OGD37452.1 MAG: hypothetical protein A2850_02675 [Candidatus Azambacteria bacterium RIFCSPHIGHO2_01_FULL_51_74]
MDAHSFIPQLPHIVSLFAGLMLLGTLVFLTQKGLLACINLYMLHSFFLVLILIVIAFGMGETHLYAGAAITFLLKVVLIPGMFFWLIKQIDIKREVQFYINTSTSLIIAAALVLFAFDITHRVFDFAHFAVSETAITLSLAMLFIGFFIMISRTQALNQMLGLLIVENSLFLLASVTTFGIPLVLEIGISFDVLIALLIMGIFIFKINQTFHHIDVSRLQKNKE